MYIKPGQISSTHNLSNTWTMVETNPSTTCNVFFAPIPAPKSRAARGNLVTTTQNSSVFPRVIKTCRVFSWDIVWKCSCSSTNQNIRYCYTFRMSALPWILLVSKLWRVVLNFGVHSFHYRIVHQHSSFEFHI